MSNSDGNRTFPLDWGEMRQAIGPRIRLLRNLLTSRSVSALEEFGLPSGSLSIMALMTANPERSQTDFARQLGMNKSVVVALVDELEKRGLAERVRSTQDRRRNSLRLTSAGREQMGRMMASQMMQEDPLRDEFSSEEWASLSALLDRAYAALLRDDALRQKASD